MHSKLYFCISIITPIFETILPIRKPRTDKLLILSEAMNKLGIYFVLPLHVRGPSPNGMNAAGL